MAVMKKNALLTAFLMYKFFKIMIDIQTNLNKIRARIAEAEQLYQRVLGSVKLLAASKGQSLEKIQQAIDAGQKCFGESYLQEALTKINTLPKNLEWHFIGNIQSNKTRAIAENFSWVQSVSRKEIAERLHKQRPNHLPPLQICIEVNVSEETNKSGVSLGQIRELANTIQQLSQLKLRGLMTIPAKTDNLAQQHVPYRKLRQIYEELQAEGFALDTLSMGMSDDFESAIAEGSTMIRIGTAIFGER